MRARPLVFLATAGLVLLTWASPAMAKGPDQATITGPGLDAPIVVSGYGEPGSGDDLGGLADGSGVFRVLFGPSASDQNLDSEPPPGDLGPKFEIAYRFPDGSAAGSTLRQDLYPYAPGGPVIYTPAGQSVYGTTATGGWLRAPRAFSAVLQGLGLPATPVAVPHSTPASRPQPASAPASSATPASRQQAAGEPVSSSTPWLPVAAAVLAVLVIAAVVLRRRGSVPRR